MTEQTESSITTFSGRFFDILRPQEYDYDIEEIGHSLSHICRYTGHVNSFYSVAEHSVLVSKLVPDNLALDALLHDASEAFLGDVSSPLKKLLPEYKKIEENVQKAIFNHFGLEWPMRNEIHVADKKMYWQERQGVADNGVRDTLWHQDRAAARKVEAKGMPSHMAKRMFLARYKEIMKNNDKGNEQVRREAEKASAS